MLLPYLEEKKDFKETSRESHLITATVLYFQNDLWVVY